MSEEFIPAVLSVASYCDEKGLARIAAVLKEEDTVRGSINLPFERDGLIGFPDNIILPAFNNLLKKAEFVYCADRTLELMAHAYERFGVPRALIEDKPRSESGIALAVSPQVRPGGLLSAVSDTETTGKWVFRSPPTHNDQPDIVQLASLLGSDVQHAHINFIVRSLKPCDPGATAAHGISEEAIQRYGVPLEVAVPIFNALLRAADRLVCHNVEFDSKVIARAYWQHGSDPNIINQKNQLCTMKPLTNAVKAPGGRGGQYKWPTLTEAYKHFVDASGFDGAHDAMNDVMACWQILMAAQNQGILR